MSLCSCFRAYPTKDVVDLAAVPRQHVYSSSGPIELSEEERMTLVAEIDRTRSPSLLVQEPQLIVGPPITPNDRSRATMADATSTSEVPDYTLMISIVQSLMSLPSNGHLTTTVIPRYMAKLCHSLGLSYCKLTALSVSGKFHQNLGTATMGEPDLSFLNVITARAKLDASEALTDRFSAHSTAAIDYSGDEPSSRDSTQRQKQGPCQIHGEKPAPCSSFPSLVNIVSRGTRADPLMSIVNEDGSNIGSLPIDWQPMVLTHGLRSITCIPIFSAPPPPSAKAEDSHPLFGQSNLLGCLTLGSTSPLQWQSQGWFSGLSLLVAWTSGLLSTHRSMRMLEFCEQVESSSSIDEMAAAFVHLFPSPSAHDELMQVEVRLALVYSKLNRAAIFVPSPEHPSVSLSQKSSLREGGGGNTNFSHTSIITSSFNSSSFNMFRNTSLKSGTGMSVDYTISEEDGDGEGDDEKEEEVKTTGDAAKAESSPASSLSINQEASFGSSKKVTPLPLSQSPFSKRSSLSKTTLNEALSNPSVPSPPISLMGPPPTAPPGRKQRAVVTLAGALSAGYIQIGDGTGSPEMGEGQQTSSSGSLRGREGDRTSRNTGRDRSSHMSWRSSHADRVKLTQRIEIATNGTMIMSSLEAGDMMVVKDSISKNKLVPPDLSLEDYPSPAGTQILLLPLIYKSRPMGCVYVFIRSGNFGMGWHEMGEMISGMVFQKLSGELRAEWSATLTEETFIETSGGPPPPPGPISAPLIRLQASDSLKKYRRVTVEGNTGNGDPENDGPRLVKSSSVGKKLDEVVEDQGIILTTRGASEELVCFDKHSSSSPVLSLNGKEVIGSDEKEAPRSVSDCELSVSQSGGERVTGKLTSTQIAAAMSKSRSTTLNQLGKEEDVNLDLVESLGKGIILGGGSVRDSKGDDKANMANDDTTRTTHERGSWLPEVPAGRRALFACRSMPARGRDSRVSFSPTVPPDQPQPENTQSTFDPASFFSTTPSPAISSSHVDRASRTSASGAAPNAPGSGLSSTKLVKLNPAINRVLKANKLVEPYVNRHDRKSQTFPSIDVQRSHVSENLKTSPVGTDLEIMEDEGTNGDTSLMEAEAEEESNSRSTSLSLVAARELINATISYAPLPRDLAFWPELIKMGLEFHSSPQKSLFFSEFQGHQTLLKVLRRPTTAFDSRPCISSRHLKLLQRLSDISHPNLVRLLMVFPAVFEITQGERSLRDDPRTQITGIQPRRGKFKRCSALLTENFERSISLAEAISNGTLLMQGMVPLGSSKGRGTRSRHPPVRSYMEIGSKSSASRMHLTPVSSEEEREEAKEEGGDVFDEGLLSPSAPGGGGLLTRMSNRRTSAQSSPGVAKRSSFHTLTSRAAPRDPNLPLIRIILIQVAAGLRALHQSGLLHGEVTPENVLILMPSALMDNEARGSNNSTSGRIDGIQSRSSASSLPLPPHPRSQGGKRLGLGPGSSSSGAFGRISESSMSRGPSEKVGSSVGFGGFPSSASVVGKADRSSRGSPAGSNIFGPGKTKSVGFSSGSSSTMKHPPAQPSAASTSAAVKVDGNDSNNPKRSYTLALVKQPGSRSNSKGSGSVDPNVLLCSYPSDTSDFGLLGTDGSNNINPKNAPKVPSSKPSEPSSRPSSTPSTEVDPRSSPLPNEIDPRSSPLPSDLDPKSSPLPSEIDARSSPLPNEGIRLSSNLQGARLSSSFFANNSLSGRSLQVQVKLKDAALCVISLDPTRAQGSTLRPPVMVQKLTCRPRPSNLAYLPPEVLQQRQRPKRSADVYAFGVLMWEMFNGRRVPGREEEGEEMKEPLELEWAAEAPAQYRALAEKCLSADLEVRPNLKSILRALVQMSD